MAKRLGYIYFLKTEGGTAIKVGYTAEYPDRRIASIQTGNHELLILHGYIRGTMKREASLHARLASYRLRGEWFRCCPEVLAVVDALIARHPDTEPPPQKVKREDSYTVSPYAEMSREEFDAIRTRDLWELGDMVADRVLSAADREHHYACREKYYAPRGTHPEFVPKKSGE